MAVGVYIQFTSEYTQQFFANWIRWNHASVCFAIYLDLKNKILTLW